MNRQDIKTARPHPWIDRRNEFAIGAYTGANNAYLPGLIVMFAGFATVVSGFPGQSVATGGLTSIVTAAAVDASSRVIGSKEDTLKERPAAFLLGRAFGLVAPFALGAFIGIHTPDPHEKPRHYIPDISSTTAAAEATPQESLEIKMKSIPAQGGLVLRYS